MAFSWPYLVYTITASDGTSTTFRVRNLATNQDTPLPSLEAFANDHADPTYSPVYSIVGDTLIAAVPSDQTATQTNSYEGQGTTTFYALVHLLSGGTPPQVVGTFRGDALDIVRANTWVLAVTKASTKTRESHQIKVTSPCEKGSSSCGAALIGPDREWHKDDQDAKAPEERLQAS